MDWKQSYTDTCAELRILQLRELELRKQWEAALQYTWKGEMPSSVYCHIDLDKGLEMVDRAAARLHEAVEATTRVEMIKVQMEVYMNEFTGTVNVIKCKRLEGKSYKQIEAETGYSQAYARKLISESNKEVTHSTNVS
jgi:hypothetical protein